MDMASISSRAKSFSQPEGGFLGITRFEQFDGKQPGFIEEGMDCFINKTLKKNIFPEPYNSYEKSIRLLKKTILTLVRLEDIMFGNDSDRNIENLFSKALKGAQNIGDAQNAFRLLERIKKADHGKRLSEDRITLDPDTFLGVRIEPVSEDVFDEGVMSAVCELSSYEYYANERYKGTHYHIELSDNFSSYLFEACIGIKDTCLSGDLLDVSLRPAFTDIVDSGSIDVLSGNEIWKIFLSTEKKPKPSTPETLEVLMQYLMLCRVSESYKDKIKFLGIYDPDRNLAYEMKTKDISPDIIAQVEKDVIGY